jgi:DNA-binding XRE family transcriptional regulator
LQGLLLRTKTSQATLADALGISRQAVNYYSNGITLPDLEKLNKIARFFDVSVAYLTGEISTMKIENANIGERLGLSDKAIAAIESFSVGQKIALDYLLKNDKTALFLFAVHLIETGKEGNQ